MSEGTRMSDFTAPRAVGACSDWTVPERAVGTLVRSWLVLSICVTSVPVSVPTPTCVVHLYVKGAPGLYCYSTWLSQYCFGIDY